MSYQFIERGLQKRLPTHKIEVKPDNLIVDGHNLGPIWEEISSFVDGPLSDATDAQVFDALVKMVEILLFGPLDRDLAKLYDDCRFLSGGFDQQSSWATVVAYGPIIIIRLLSDLSRDDDNNVHPWVIFSLLDAVVPEEDRPKLENEEDRGRLAPVREMWLAWGQLTYPHVFIDTTSSIG
jgi:hypothetical protein